jgi:hypothetical protein
MGLCTYNPYMDLTDRHYVSAKMLKVREENVF